ncbi:UDP-galactopyranose mutase [Flavobacterium sp. FBOR7N2.3]|uniref:UDP-galactopyranose mutase n=1 Tax=Flavobacterium magnesitis TaxID=3138077 RepID=A0ABV4TIY8_9FLAO
MKNIDILIIGAGISGCVLAERYATIGKKVLIIEKRKHIAGNCYDYIDENDILISQYGPHLFHTNDQSVWEYVNQFSEWHPLEHKETASNGNKTVPISVNSSVTNELFIANVTNEEEIVLNHVKPVQLEKADKYQGLPKGGYTQLFKNILTHPNIEVLLETDYFDIKEEYTNYENLFYTGPVDRFFEFTHNFSEKLECRSIHYVSETFDDEIFDENPVVNAQGMDQVFKNALDLFNQLEKDKKTIYKTAV